MRTHRCPGRAQRTAHRAQFATECGLLAQSMRRASQARGVSRAAAADQGPPVVLHFCFAMRSERREGVRSSVLCEWRRFGALRAGVIEPRPVGPEEVVAVSSSRLARLARVSSQLASSEARDSGRSSERLPPLTISSPSTSVAAVEPCSSSGGGGGGTSVGSVQPRTGDLLGRAAEPSRAAALSCTRAGEGDLEARR